MPLAKSSSAHIEYREHATTAENIADESARVLAWNSCAQNVILPSWFGISKTYLVDFNGIGSRRFVGEFRTVLT